MKQIGKGTFTTAYLKPNGKVLLKSIDMVKEAMAYGFFPDHRLFPNIVHVDTGDNFKYYEMEFYEQPKSLKNNLTPRQWRLYKILRSLSIECTFNPYLLMDRWYTEFKRIPNEFAGEREALLDALSGLSNYSTDIRFEISPRNVAVKGKKLILLDCFFFDSDLEKAWNS